MRRMFKIIPGAVMAASAVAGISLASTAPAEAETKHGCPSGYLCMYTKSGYDAGKPKHKFYKYGVHKLHNEYGYRAWINNQTGDAAASINKGSNGGGFRWELDAGFYTHFDVTPYNSVTLYRP